MIILSGEMNGQLFDFLKNESIDAIIGYLTNNDLINIVYYKVIFNVILERNKAFSNNTLEEFIKKARKKENFFKLTPPIIYYGKN